MFCSVIWKGPVYGFTGYSRSRSLALELYKLGVNIRLIPSFKNKVLIKDFNLFQKLENNQVDCEKCAHVECDVPFNLNRDHECYSIAYTMFETSNIDKQWIKNINKFDRLWVPNKWNRDNFQICGVEIPIDVVPFGVDSELFNYKNKVKKKNFTFLFVGVYLERKNWNALYNVFIKNFADKKDVDIVFKFSGDVKHLAVSDTSRIKIINQGISDFELAKIYSESDCIVLPSYAEGVGLPVLEGYASGLPAVFTDAPFFDDFKHKDISFPINVSSLTTPSQEHISLNKIYKDSLFYKVCEYDLVEKMNKVIEMTKRLRDMKDKCFAFASKFSWKNSATKVIKILDSLD